MEQADVKKLVNRAARKSGDRKVLSCRSALALAEKHGIRPIEVGRACDDLNVRIVTCQLGCFK